jgi:hypothetical protein
MFFITPPVLGENRAWTLQSTLSAEFGSGEACNDALVRRTIGDNIADLTGVGKGGSALVTRTPTSFSKIDNPNRHHRMSGAPQFRSR